MASSLCYIGKVVSLEPITGADRILLATVVVGEGGKWRGVVPKEGLTVNDLCQVYLQDSLVPKTPEFAFMESRGWRVKMAKFRGVPSEALIMAKTLEGSLGDDVTEQAGVTRYEKQIPQSMQGPNAGNFPSFIHKTDEPNFQGVHYLVDALRGKPWVATEKADGTSCTVYNHEGHIGVCSRNWEKKDDGANVYWRAAKACGLIEAVTGLEGLAIQCEIVGPGIQANRLGLKEIEIRVFDIWNIPGPGNMGCYAPQDVLTRMYRDFAIKQVRYIADGDYFDLDGDSMQDLAEGTYPGTDHQREGLVFRPIDPFFVGHERCSFKCINLRYRD